MYRKVVKALRSLSTEQQMADWSFWIVSLVLNKYLLCCAVAASIGSVFMLTQTKATSIRQFSWRYGLWASGIGLFLAVVDFFLQVGLFADAGLAGLVDPVFIVMIGDSPIGTQFLLRFVAWLLLTGVLVWNRDLSHQKLSIWSLLIAGLALVLLSLSCVQVGHTTEQTMVMRVVAGLHFLIGLWWMGCLWPLAFSCSRLAPLELQELMERFGTIASYLVPILLLAGVSLAYVLTGTLTHLFTHPHGQLLLIKVLLVATLLGLAAYHKLALVPQLSHPHKIKILQRSIYYEMVLGGGVIALTTLLSSVFGPATMMN